MKATVEGLVERVNDLHTRVSGVTKEKPLTSLGVAFGVGACVGAVLTVVLSRRD